MKPSFYFLFYLNLDWACHEMGYIKELIKTIAKEVYPHRVICVNRPADLLVGALRHRDRLANSLSYENLCYVSDNLVLCRPFYPLNDYAASWIPGFNNLQCIWLRRFLAKMGLAPTPDDQVIIWLFSYHHWPFARLFPSPLVVYHPVDEYTLTAQGQSRPQALWHEKRMFRECDIVFTVSEGLAHKKAAFHDNIHCLGQGVSFDLFSQSMDPKTSIPQELIDIPAPRIGLVGNIRDWIDFPLIHLVLQQRPDWSVVFIGPQDRSAAGDLEPLQRYPNFFWLGPKPFEELPYWLAGLDVSIVPYLQTEFTRFINPIKMYEYWAAGLPIVITNIGEFQPVKDCLWVAHSGDEFIASIREAIQAQSLGQKELRMQLAEAHSWENWTKQALGYLDV